MRVWLVLACLAIPIGCSPTPPSSTPPSGQLAPLGTGGFDSPYFPFEAGKRLVYALRAQVNDQQHEGQVAYDVLEASPNQAKVQVTTTVAGRSQSVIQTYTRQADGTVVLTTPAGGSSQEPATQTDDPAMLEPGLRQEGPQGAVMSTSRDTVVVPAGTFEAVKVTIQAPEEKGSVHTWFAKGVGLIKTESRFRQEGAQASSLLELIQY